MSLALALLAGWLFIGTLGGAATGWLVRHVWRRQPPPSFPVRSLAIAAVMGTIGSMLGTAFGVVKVLLAMQDGTTPHPSERMRTFARGISFAMNSMALGLVVWVPTIVIAVAFLRRERRRRASQSQGL